MSSSGTPDDELNDRVFALLRDYSAHDAVLSDAPEIGRRLMPRLLARMAEVEQAHAPPFPQTSSTSGAPASPPTVAPADDLRKVPEIIASLRSLGQHDLADHLQQRYEQATAATFRLLVVGEAKTGKTAFINAILRAHVLPTSPLPTASVLTTVRWAEPNCERLTVFFRQPRPFPLPPLSDEVREHVLRARDAAVSPLVLPVDAACRLIVDGMDLDRSYSPAAAFERILIERPLAFCRNGVEVSDTPALDANTFVDPPFVHSRKQADMIVFVMSSTSPCRATELRYLEQLTSHGECQNVLVACNRFDAVRPNEQLRFKESVRRVVAPYLQHTPLGTNGIFFTSCSPPDPEAADPAATAGNELESLRAALDAIVHNKREATRSEQLAWTVLLKTRALPDRLRGGLDLTAIARLLQRSSN